MCLSIPILFVMLNFHRPQRRRFRLLCQSGCWNMDGSSCCSGSELGQNRFPQQSDSKAQASFEQTPSTTAQHKTSNMTTQQETPIDIVQQQTTRNITSEKTRISKTQQETLNAIANKEAPSDMTSQQTEVSAEAAAVSAAAVTVVVRSQRRQQWQRRRSIKTGESEQQHNEVRMSLPLSSPGPSLSLLPCSLRLLRLYLPSLLTFIVSFVTIVISFLRGFAVAVSSF